MSGSPLNRIPRSRMPVEYQGVWDTMHRLVGDATAIEVLANSMPVTRWYFENFYQNLFRNADPGMLVSNRTKQLIRLRLSKQHGCALCNRGNEEQARETGFTDPQIRTLLDARPDESLFTAAELATIEFADQMMLHNSAGQLTQALYQRLRQHFTDAEIVEIAMGSAVLVGAAKMMFVLDLVPREANCPFPHVQTLPAAAARERLRPADAAQ